MEEAAAGSAKQRSDRERITAYLEEPPARVVRQLEHSRTDPERLLPPMANTVSTEVFGSPHNWREVLPYLEEMLQRLQGEEGQ